ncbi:hypothetical protein [Sandaracinobacteroides sp. A072]|uniref:hypothetical protein n=1 Tax=Sandaracinobacteroides sp. A072 TaxID=3461146 RepID=UPI0040422533
MRPEESVGLLVVVVTFVVERLGEEVPVTVVVLVAGCVTVLMIVSGSDEKLATSSLLV